MKKLIILLSLAVLLTSAAFAGNSFYPSNKAPFPESKFSQLPLGAVKPQGWLKTQLEIQSETITGNLPKFWADLGHNSGWLGGTGENWERGPYYMDGMVPLAFLTGDRELMAWAKKWVGWTLSHQQANGDIGPANNNDWWPRGVMLKVLTQYYEATGDSRVIPLMHKFFKYMLSELPQRQLSSWGQFRWADTAISAQWLYNRTGEEYLLDLMKLLQKQGFDWTLHFTEFKNTGRTEGDKFGMHTHGVNNSMGIKAPAAEYVITGDEKYKAAVYTAMANLDKYHGQATGIFTSDEHYAGKNPSQGTELCAVVEYMFSLENMISDIGDPAFADRLEKITFNALPGTFSADMWAHQYDQQANQVMCGSFKDRIYTNNGENSNAFGLEPNYGCCTANLHQGWPKYVSSLWMATPDNGLAAISYAPCSVTAKVADGTEVTMDVNTEYPFEDTVQIVIHTPKAITFPLVLRIPGWADGASVKINGKKTAALAGRFGAVKREWKDGDVVVLSLPMQVKSERRFNDSVTLTRGPLVYSLKIGEDWQKLVDRPICPDWSISPTTPWNYGLALDLNNLDKSVKFEKRAFGKYIFSPDDAPVMLKVSGKKVSDWKIERNAAAPPPQSPVVSNEPVEELTLIPYGCAKLRITEFPLVKTN